jgi:hypothetical protein
MRLVAAVLSEFSDHSDHSDQPKLPAVPRLRSLTLKAFHLEEGNATNLIIALNSIVSRASQVATSTNLRISWKWRYSSSPKDSSQKKRWYESKQSKPTISPVEEFCGFQTVSQRLHQNGSHGGITESQLLG